MPTKDTPHRPRCHPGFPTSRSRHSPGCSAPEILSEVIDECQCHTSDAP